MDSGLVQECAAMWNRVFMKKENRDGNLENMFLCGWFLSMGMGIPSDNDLQLFLDLTK